MIHHRTTKEVRSFDIFKLIITVVLVLILLLGYMFGCFQPSAPAGTVADTTPSTGTDADAGAGIETPTKEVTTEATEEVTEEPPAPQIDAPRLGSLSDGDVLPPGELALSGSGTADTDLEVLLNGNVDGTTRVGSDGTWAYTTSIDNPGEYELGLNALDADGNVAASSDPINFTVEAPQPEIAVPTVELPDLSRLDPLADGLPLTGTGTPGSQVEIVLNGQVIDTVTVGEDGTWAATIPIDEPGEYELGLNALDADGNVAASSDPVNFTVEAPQPEIAVPTVELPDLSQIDPLTDGLPLTGTGTPGSQVEIVLNGEVIDTITVGEDGTWSYTAAIDEPGDYELSLNALDADGNVAASSDPVSFTVEAPAEETGATTGTSEEVAEIICEEEYIVVADDWLSKLSDKYWGDIFLYPAIMTATNQKQQSDDTFATIDNVDLIEPGWKLCIVDAATAAQLVEEK